MTAGFAGHFPHDIEMDFCSKADTAIRYLHANDWSIKEVPNAERWIKVGDESDVFDLRLTTARKNNSSIGGWIYCRVGLYLPIGGQAGKLLPRCPHFLPANLPTRSRMHRCHIGSMRPDLHHRLTVPVLKSILVPRRIVLMPGGLIFC